MVCRRWRIGLLVCGLVLGLAACTRTPDELLADAKAAIAAGEIRTAEIHLKNLLQQDPDNATARALLGSVSLSTGDAAAAEQSLRRAVQLGADPAGLQVPLVMSLVQQGKFTEALEQLAGAPAVTGPDRIALLRLEGMAQRGLRAYARAETAYRAALGAEPSSIDTRTDLASVLIEEGRAPEARALIDAVLMEQPQSVPALLLRGNLESSDRQYATAEVTFQQVADLEAANSARSPAYQVALAQLVDAQLAQGKVDAAAANAATLLKASPRGAIAQYMMAAVEVRQNNLDSAERRLESVIADSPKYWPAHRLLGAINVQQNRLGQATMYLRAAVTNDPADNAARLQLAELYIRQGDLDAARKLIDAAPSAQGAIGDGLFFAFAARASQQAGLAEQAAQYFQQSEQQAPKDVQQLVGMSSMYVAAGEFERAIRVLESASFADAQSEHVADYLLALIQVRQGQLRDADATAQRLVAEQPNAAWPLNLRAAIAIAGKDFAAARELLLKAVANDPKNTGALLNLARVANAQKNDADAERYLERAMEVNPQEPMAAIGLAQLAAARGDFAAAQGWLDRLPASPLRDRLAGDLLAAQGKFDAAADAFGRAYTAQPSGDLALRAYGAASRAGLPDADSQLRIWSANHPQDPAPNFALGSIAIEKGQQDEAARRFEAVLAANPNHAPTLNNLAWLYGERGDARALDFAERARASEPKNAAIADTLGWLQLRQGNAAKALPLLAEAAAGLSAQAEVLYHYGVALAETGDRAQALATLQSALAGAGDAAWRGDAERRLEALRNR